MYTCITMTIVIIFFPLNDITHIKTTFMFEFFLPFFQFYMTKMNVSGVHAIHHGGVSLSVQLCRSIVYH